MKEELKQRLLQLNREKNLAFKTKFIYEIKYRL